MSQASIDSVQSWLSFELEQRGIDAVVYARHILNLFLSSHYATDMYLAKKEANIFARLPPGSNKSKPKQKYRKRSSSSPFHDEIALKKEIAADCLRSAADEVVVDADGASIDALVEDLYDKLNSLNLLSSSGSNSDERRVGKPKEKHHETYHDAFPLLFNMPENVTKVNNQLDTVWNGQPIFKKKNLDTKETNPIGKEKPVETHAKSERSSKWATTKNSPQQLKFNGRSKKFNNPRRCSRRRLHPFDSVKKSPRSYRPKSLHQQRRKERWEYDKENSNEAKSLHTPPRKINKYGSKVFKANSHPQARRSFFDNAGMTANFDQWFGDNVFSSNASGNGPVLQENENASSSEKDISHLYSMGLPDFYKSPNSNDAPSSKWFRDPQSGCLEFEPAFKNRSSSDTSPSSVESWLWCPSPSLWDDGEEQASQSRFETIYKPPARSNSDSQASQLWKDYEAIFTDVAQETTVRDCTNQDGKFPYVDSNNNESYAKDDFAEELAFLEQALPASAWLDDAHQIFVDEDDSIGDLKGLFGTAPPISTGQSRREIWLKNSEALKKEKQSGLFLIGNEFTSAGEDLSTKGRSTLASWLHLDEFLYDLSLQIRECCNLHWLFGWDFPEEMPQASYPFSIPTGLPFPNPQLDFSRLQDIYSNTLGASLEVGHAPGFDDDVFASNLFSPNKVENIPWTLLFEDPRDPIAFLSDVTSVQQAPKHDVTTTSSLEDCVTENQAWKSSLRIGNMWQSISGIRRVNVLYSEKQVVHDQTPTLPPSSCTHFRPIHENELDVSDGNTVSEASDHLTSSSVDFLQSATDELIETCFPSSKIQHTCDGCSDCDMKLRGLEQDLDNLLCDVTPKVGPQASCKNFEPRFQKAGEDKSMQTTFEEHIRQIENDLCESLSIRPPKANSR